MTFGKHQFGPPPTKGKGRAIAFLREHASHQDDACVLFPFHVNRISGYCQFGFEGRMYYAHRFMCELIRGPAPSPKHQAAHECGVRNCVNPRHLSWKTLGENVLDRRKHGTARKKGTPRYKLTEFDVELIRAVPERTNIVPDLAAKFGVTESNIRHIRAGRSWPKGKYAPSGSPKAQPDRLNGAP